MSEQLAVIPGKYVDSVQLMQLTRRIRQRDDVEWAAALMGTPANREDLKGEGFDQSELDQAGANDLVIAVRAHSEEAADAAVDDAKRELDQPSPSAASGEREEQPKPRTQVQARETLPDANVVLVSVPGDYAALEAHKALSAGEHVLLFSDNVPVEDELDLKRRAAADGLLVMGPDAGTASVSGIGLGFANVVRSGRVGVIAAAGTGAQEVMTLLDRWGAGVSHVIGLGGRDLSREVGGLMALQALATLEADAGTEAILLVSKPPQPDVARRILGRLEETPYPAIAALLGLDPGDEATSSTDVTVSRTLEGSVLATLSALGLPGADPTQGLARVAAHAVEGLSESRRALRGLFSGGTLCYETLILASRWLGPVYSNTPLRPEWGLPAPDDAHVCLDLGEEEYTKGRPHPMIDPDARVEHLLAAGEDPATAVVLLDVVLGHSAHDDPASVLAPACARIRGRPEPPAVVAYVLGSDQDPQDRNRQREQLEAAGCVLAPTASRAALLAAAIAARRPEIAEDRP